MDRYEASLRAEGRDRRGNLYLLNSTHLERYATAQDRLDRTHPIFVEYIISTEQQEEVHYVHITDPEDLERFFADDPLDNYWDFEQELELRLEYDDVMEGDFNVITRQQYEEVMPRLDGTFLCIHDIQAAPEQELETVLWEGRNQPAVFDLIYQHDQPAGRTSHQWLPNLPLEELHRYAVLMMAPMRGIQIPIAYSIVRRSTGEVIAVRQAIQETPFWIDAGRCGDCRVVLDENRDGTDEDKTAIGYKLAFLFVGGILPHGKI
jgi:hypothetical protein